MKKIGLLSDTHGFLDEKVLEHLKDCDEIWHAGDIGNVAVSQKLSSLKPLKAVFGNVDGGELRSLYQASAVFQCEDLKVLITHIGGVPGRYFPEALKLIKENRPELFICGHSHILKVMQDKKYKMLYINPGAAGKEGFHRMKTVIRFDVTGKKIENLVVIELGLRAAIEVAD